MSRKSMDEFAVKLATTPEWVALSKVKQQEAADRNEFMSWLANFACQQGYDVTVDDIIDMNREFNRQ